MAYAYSRRKVSFRKSARTTRSRVRRGKVPVPKKRTSYVRKNALAINSLARMQRRIRNMSYGMLQTSFQRLATQDLEVTNLKPILFDGCDFIRQTYLPDGVTTRQGCHVFTLAQDSLHPEDPHSYHPVLATHFISAQSNNTYYLQENDIIDGGKYKPVYADYTFRFQGLAFTKPMKIIIQTFTVKPSAFSGVHVLLGTHHKRMLPDGLSQMQNMANPTINQLSKEFFKVYSTKVITMYPTNHSAAAVIENTKEVRMIVKPKRLRVQHETNPISMTDTNGEIADGNFGHLNVPIGQPYWFLISTDQSLGTPVSCKVSISRKVAWRDHVGAA